MKYRFWLLGLAVFLLAGNVFAQPARNSDGSLGSPLLLVLTLAVVSLAPFLFMTLTAFVKISTVLQIVRGAIGAQGVPSNTVVMALATALSLIAMAPIASPIIDEVLPVFVEQESAETSKQVWKVAEATREPLRRFLKANASSTERVRFLEVARAARPAEQRADVGPDDLLVLAPAFMVTELMEAFSLGFIIYLPFLIIDLVVANVLLSLGMQMINPTQVSLPFKLLLFVAVDGWGLLARALVSGYSIG